MTTFRKWFVPQDDITAYELAQIFANVGPGPLADGVWFQDDDPIADDIARHFGTEADARYAREKYNRPEPNLTPEERNEAIREGLVQAGLLKG